MNGFMYSNSRVYKCSSKKLYCYLYYTTFQCLMLVGYLHMLINVDIFLTGAFMFTECPTFYKGVTGILILFLQLYSLFEATQRGEVFSLKS